MNYRFHRAALAEHLDEVAFYESRLPGLGADYLAEYEAIMGRICATPDLFPCVADSDIRKAGFRRFPFHAVSCDLSGGSYADRHSRHRSPTAPPGLLGGAHRKMNTKPLLRLDETIAVNVAGILEG
ncbi:hypothetical protein ACW73L_03280 [Methylolobus aquaticus]